MYSRVVFCWVWQEAWILDNVFEKPETGIHYARCCTSTQQEVSCDRAYQPWKGRGKVNRSLESKLTYHTWRKEIATRLREVPKQKNIDGIWEEEVLIGWAKTTLGRKSEVRRRGWGRWSWKHSPAVTGGICLVLHVLEKADWQKGSKGAEDS